MLKTIAIERDGFRVVVSEASALIGMKRTRLKMEVYEKQRTREDTDIDRDILELLTYPDLAAAAVEFDPSPLPDFESFLELPEMFVAEWGDAVYKLNPHWASNQEAANEQEKKAPESASD